ncbi:OsmC family protein [Pseudoalteromonas shioyasakiensis]|uniref:OsmC family protein n=1 Tax=Pseudoalteromonas shioyasakiensis TaxID=1190813 RepID=UPI0021190761|nr:OsmC family protein [Pseudoalteromonas shioyasakiensis]MCQ8880073.1 OsmC family protein [Pseudoalteromonas shioyasakiensis]
MSEYSAKVTWSRSPSESFIDNKYSRGHQWQFDGGAAIEASSSPHIVPLPYSVAENVDPEEAFVASLSSCHMLFFLSIAAKKRFVVQSYTDNAVGVMEKGVDNRMAMTEVVLKPCVKFSGEQATAEQLEEMHHQAHELCFIANSVKTKVTTEVVL